MLEQGKLMTEPMIGRHFQYSQAVEAYRFIDEHPEKTLKTLFHYDDVLA